MRGPVRLRSRPAYVNHCTRRTHEGQTPLSGTYSGHTEDSSNRTALTYIYLLPSLPDEHVIKRTRLLRTVTSAAIAAKLKTLQRRFTISSISELLPRFGLRYGHVRARGAPCAGLGWSSCDTPAQVAARVHNGRCRVLCTLYSTRRCRGFAGAGSYSETGLSYALARKKRPTAVQRLCESGERRAQEPNLTPARRQRPRAETLRERVQSFCESAELRNRT